MNLAPAEAESIVGQADIHLQRNELDRALEQLDAALAADPDHSVAWYLFAEAARRNNDLSTALKHIHKAVELDLFNFTARYARIELYFMTRNFEAMQVELKFAEDVRPLDPQMHRQVVGAGKGRGFGPKGACLIRRNQGGLPSK
jgi:tetratricopeptide (TPR) repeat protein